MSVDTTQTLFDEYLGALRSGGDFARFFSDDVLMVQMETGDEVRGRDAVRDSIATLHRQVFDGRMDVRRAVACGDVAVLEADFVGTQQQEFAGIPPTGATVRVSYSVVYDIAGNQIAALRLYMPVSSMIAQLRAAAG